MITPEQSRAARGLLDWTQSQLAERAHLSESSIRHFEKRRKTPSINNRAAIRRALEDAGVAFIDATHEGPGVRLRQPIKA
jgi:transcriptional regulator with XRE-family HTH domain